MTKKESKNLIELNYFSECYQENVINRGNELIKFLYGLPYKISYFFLVILHLVYFMSNYLFYNPANFVFHISLYPTLEKYGKLQITSTLTFAAACAAAGITVLISNDLDNCARNHCTRFETATAMAFMSWFTVSPSFLLNFWSMASR